MPAKTPSQQRLFCMALAVRKGDLKRSEVNQSVLDIVDSDMTDQQIKDFTVLKEGVGMRRLAEYMVEALKKLGSGAEGAVYDLGDGRVRKEFHKGRVPLAYQILKIATDNNDIQCLPKVYEVGPDYIIRENCKPNTPKCKEYYKVAMSPVYVGHDTLYWGVMNEDYWYDPDKDAYFTRIKGIIRGRQLEVKDWLCRLKYELSQIKGENAGLGDFALKNFGETDDGRVVMMDF